MLNCKKTSKLASQAMDEELPFWKNIALKTHLLMCSNCKNFTHQLEFLRKASLNFTANQKLELSAEARQRIASRFPDN